MKVTNDDRDSFESDLEARMSGDSTASSVFYTRASRNNAAHSFFKRYFKESEYDLGDEADCDNVFSFVDKFSNSEIKAADDGTFISAAAKAAAQSKNHLELMDNTLANLRDLFVKADYQNNSLEKLMTNYEARKEKFTRLNSIITSLPDDGGETQNDLLATLNEEILSVSSELFDEMNLTANKEVKSNNSNIIPSSPSINLLSPSKSPEACNERVHQENTVLAAVFSNLTKVKYKFPTRKDSDPDSDLEQNDLLRKQILPLITSETKSPLLKKLLTEKTGAGEIYDELLKIDKDGSNSKQYYKILMEIETPSSRTTSIDSNLSMFSTPSKSSEASSSNNSVAKSPSKKSSKANLSEELLTQNIKLMNLAKSKDPKWDPNNLITHDNFISYSIDDNLVSTFAITSEKRPNTQYGYFQKDHTTAYCALLVAAINSIPPIARSRDLPEYVEDVVNLILKNPIPKIKSPDDFDKRRRDTLSKLKLLDQDKSDLNELLKAHNLRSSNNDVCATVNIFLTQMNVDDWASFAQGGESRDEQKSIEYMTKLNKIYNLVGNLNEISSLKLSGGKKTEIFRPLFTALEKDLSDFPTQHLKDLGAMVNKEALTIELQDRNSVIGKLSNHFFEIFDLSYPHLKQTEKVGFIASDQQDQYMINVATGLMERHFKILGVMNSSALIGITDSVGADESFNQLTKNFLEKFFQESNNGKSTSPTARDLDNLTPDEWRSTPSSTSSGSLIFPEFGPLDNIPLNRKLFDGDSPNDLNTTITSKSISPTNLNENFKTLFSKLAIDAGKSGSEIKETILKNETEIFEFNKSFLLNHLSNLLKQSSIGAHKIMTGYYTQSLDTAHSNHQSGPSGEDDPKDAAPAKNAAPAQHICPKDSLHLTDAATTDHSRIY